MSIQSSQVNIQMNSGKMPLSFVPEPQEIVFTDYNAGTIYKQKFCLRNLYSTSCAVKISLKKKTKYFRLESVKRMGKIAPGLEVQYFVIFQPDAPTQNYSNSIIISTEFGNLEIPVFASNACDLDVVTVNDTSKVAITRQTSVKSTFSKTGHLLLQQNNIPKEIIFEKSPVKSQSSKEIYIRNNSQDIVSFDITSEEPFFIEITDQLKLLGKKQIDESLMQDATQSVSLRPGDGIQISIVFSPKMRYSDISSILRFQYKPSGDIEEIVLRGSSEDVNCKLSLNSLQLPNTFIQKINQSTFQLINNSDTRLKFSWRTLPSYEDEEAFIQDSQIYENDPYGARQFDEKTLFFNNEAFSITPLEGEIWPGTEFTFTVDFHPSIEGNYKDIIAWCDVSGRELRLPISLNGLAYGPQIQFSFSSLDVGNVYINSKQNIEVYLENRGKVDAEFKLLQSHSLFSSSFNFIPSTGNVKAGDVQLIKITFQPDLIGEFSETFQWHISGSSEPRLLHLAGNVVGPSFSFDCSSIDFGTVSYNFVSTKYLNLSNTSDIPMKFKLRIPGDGTLMGREFDVVPQSGTIIPHGSKQIRIDLLSNSIKEYKTSLSLDIEDVGEDVMSLPIYATCVIPEVTLSTTNVLFGDCFITYPYQQHLEFTNTNNQPAKYEIIPPTDNKGKVTYSIDHLKGVVPSNSIHKVKISLTCLTPGSHFFPIYVRILGSERPPFEVSVQASGIGPIVTADVKKIDFGRISVLEDHTQQMILTNKSPIPANVYLSNKNSVFSCVPPSLVIDPETSVDISVIANVDDALKFSDDIFVEADNGSKFKIRVDAIGKGTSLSPSIDLNELDFGNQFTKRPCQITFDIENKGRKPQQIQWQIPYKKRKPGDDSLPEPEIFKIIPDRAQIEPKSSQTFTVEGFSEEVGEFEQFLNCKIAREKDNIFEVKLHCSFTLPLIKFSEKKLSFDYIYSSKRTPSIQNQPLTLKNVSPIDLDITIKPSSDDAFSVEQSSYIIAPGESAMVNVLFNPSYKGDLISHNIKQKLIVSYAKHPQKDSIDLLGSINFPNVKLETLEVDFGSVLNSNDKHKYVKMMNESKAVCNYKWILDVPHDSTVKYNDYFDILPTEGVLQPGEVQNMQFIFRGSINETFSTTAICQVEGGPVYEVQLKAESSSITYSISNRVVDFNLIAYDAVQSKEILLYNKGKVPYQFKFNIPPESATSIEVQPTSGVVAGESSCPVSISLFANIPDIIEKKIYFSIDNYNPEEVVIKAVSSYPSLLIDLEKVESLDYLSTQNSAIERIENGFSHLNNILEVLSKNPDWQQPETQNELNKDQQIFVETERLIYSSHLQAYPLSNRRVISNEPESTLYSTKRNQKKDLIPDEPSVDSKYAPTTYICDFGNIIKGLGKKIRFSVTNTGYFPVTLSFDKKLCTKFGFSVKPLLINELPGYPNFESQTIELYFNSKSKNIPIGQYKEIIPLRIHNGPIINLEARANIILPELNISSTVLDFGKLYISRCRFITIQIHNQQPTICEYSIEHSSSSQDPTNFIVDTVSGILEPNEKRNVEIQFIPTSQKQFSGVLQVKCAHNSKPQQIVCSGEGLELDVSISPETVQLSPVLPHIESIQKVSIFNNSDIDIEVYSLDYDKKYTEEQELLKNIARESGAIVIDPLKAGEGLPQWVIDEYEGKNQNSDEQTDNLNNATQFNSSNTISSQISNKSTRKMYACVYGPPLSGKSLVSKALSSKLNIPSISLNSILHDLPEGKSPKLTIESWISANSENNDLFPNGFVIDDLSNNYIDSFEAAQAILSGLKNQTVFFISLSVDELAIKIRNQTLQEDLLKEELRKATRPELNEDDFLDLSEEERVEYQKAIRSIRTLKKKLEQTQKMKDSLIHHRSTINKEAEEMIPALLEDFKREQEQAKKPAAKGKNEPTANPYDILDTDDEFTVRIKNFKRTFANIFKLFQNPNEEPQEKGKKNAPVENGPQKSFYFNSDRTVDDIISSVLMSIVSLYPVEDEISTQDIQLNIPEPYTKQIYPLQTIQYKKRTDLEFSLWEIKESIPEIKDPKAKKGKAPEEPQQIKVPVSRWVIPARGTADVWVQFSSKIPKEFHSVLKFGIVGRELQFSLPCSCIATFPQLDTQSKSIFSACAKSIPPKKLPTKKFYLATNTLSFGPLLNREDYSIINDSQYIETITLTNNGLFDSHIEIGVSDASEDANCFFIQPSSLDLKQNESTTVRIKAEPTVVGDIKNNIVCCIRDNPIPYIFAVHAIGTVPLVNVDSPIVDFGKLLLTDKPTARKLVLTNASTLPVNWRFDGLEKLSSEFTVTPTEGQLKYQGTEEVTIIFKTEKPCVVNGTLLLKVSDSGNLVQAEDKKIEIKSEAYDLKIDMNTSLDLGTVKVVDTIKKGIDMINNGKYDVKYQWIIPKSLSKHITIVPDTGILEGEASQGGKKKAAKPPQKKKGATEELEGTSLLTFQTNKVVSFKNNSSIKVLFFETEKQEKIGEVSYNISVNAIYSKYVVTPLHGLNFGPLIHGKEKIKEFEISNPGSFDIIYNIDQKPTSRPPTSQSTTQPSATKKPAPAASGKKDPKSKEPEGLKIGAFTITPKDGIITPGGKALVKVSFNSDGHGLHREIVRIKVPDTKPNETYFDFDIQGESCIPGMNTSDLNSVFEEQQVVNSLSVLTPGESAFAIDEQVFSFGTVTSQSTVFESFRISNPFKVPCNISLNVQPRDKSDTASAKAFEVQPTSLFIPPHEHRYAKVFFSPQALQPYSAIFEAVTKDGSDPSTNKLKFELRGEGSLPQISLEQPTLRDTSNNPLLKFPRTLIGRKTSLPIVIKNYGVIPANYQFELNAPSSLIFAERGIEMKLEPGEVKSFNVNFTPNLPEKIECDLKLLVPDNHFEDTTIRIQAESYSEEITFENLPHGEQNIVKLDDCPIGFEKYVTFTMQNHSADHMRFDWTTSDYIHIVPKFGHIHAKSQKEISITIKSSQPKDVKGEKIKLITKKIKYQKDSTPEWDDTHRTIRWIEVEDKPEVPQVEIKKGASKKIEPQISQEPPKMIHKRVEEVDPEPKVDIIGQDVSRDLTVEGKADYSKFTLSGINPQITFAETQMFTQRELTFEMKNSGSVTLSYDWEFTEFEESAYSITPSKGTISTNSSQIFTLSFAPMEVDDHEEVLVCHIPNLDPSLKEPRIEINGYSSCPVVHFELTPSDYISSGRRDPELPGPDGRFGELDPLTRVVELESCGIKIKNSKRFFVLNPTNTSYKYQWRRLSDSQDTNMFECSASKGIIHSGKKTEVCFEYTPESLEVKECFWMFSIPEREINVPFLIVGRANEPQLYFDQPRINFNRVLVGALATSTLKLVNREEIPFSFTLEKSKFTSPNDPKGPVLISVTPSTGTIGPKQEMNLEVKFKPVKEESYNFNLVCRIKRKPNALTCNIKGDGFSVHEQLEFGDSHQLISHTKPNDLNFGNVQINDKLVKTVILYNNGDYNYDFSWQRLSNSYVTISPDVGTVEKRGKVVCNFSFNPTRPISLHNYKAVCKVTNGRDYTLQINGVGVQPKIHFSFKNFDFGPRFLHHQGARPNETIIKITNEDDRDISYDIEFENKPHLEVEGASTLLKPGDSSKVKCIFMPREYKKYHETIIFHVNGIYRIPVTLEGEGTQAKIDLSSESPKNISFGTQRVGESATQTLELVNKSKIPVTITVPRDQEQLKKNFIAIDLKDSVLLEPKSKLNVGLTFNPLARLQTFTEKLFAVIEGKEQEICNISGSCQGIEVKLNPQNVSFGMVVQNTSVTQKAILENNGDIGVNFNWIKKNFGPDITINPMQGYLPANEDLVLDITFSPTKIKSVKYDKIECKIDQSPSVFMTITGTCVNKPPQKETLSFSCPVRQKDSKIITIENPSKETWMLKPNIDNTCWTGDEFLEISAGGKSTYKITYSPIRSVKQGSSTEKVVDEATLFFPLPNGSALLYTLKGEVSPPLPSGEIILKLQAKSMKEHSVPVENWLPQAQRFHVEFNFEKIQSPDYVKGVSYLDVPSLGKKSYKFSVEIFKPGQFTGRITFINKETGEYCFYNCKFDIEGPQTIEKIHLDTPVRQKVTKSISLENPLDEEVVVSVQCANQEIIVPSEIYLQPKTTSKVDISYLPLVATNDPIEVPLILKSQKLGDYPYVLVLKALPSGPEKNIHFSVFLGGSQVQTLRFKNLCRIATEYTISFEEKDQQLFTLVDKPLIKCTPADPVQGSEVAFDVVFEPGQLGKFKSKINISSKQGGEFSFLLFGHCTPPRPQGPIEIAPNGTSQITFKNVFGDAKQKTEFKIYVDNQAFSVKPEVLSATGKQKSNLAVSFKPLKPGEIVHGRLLIEKKDDPNIKWIYYLLGLMQAPPKAK